jgi:hypothetical protein
MLRRTIIDGPDANFSHIQLARGQDAAMAGYYAVLTVDQDRVGKAKLANGCRDLRYLSIGMSAGIVDVWKQISDRRGSVGIQKTTSAACHQPSTPHSQSGARHPQDHSPTSETRRSSRAAHHHRIEQPGERDTNQGHQGTSKTPEAPYPAHTSTT